jgi:hypothetical protein
MKFSHTFVERTSIIFRSKLKDMIFIKKDFSFRFEVNSEVLKVVSLKMYVNLCKTLYDLTYHWAGT